MLLLERLKVILINASQIRMMYTLSLSLREECIGEAFGCAAVQTLVKEKVSI